MEQVGASLRGKRIAILGRLAGMRRRELVQLLRRYGAVVLEKAAPPVDILVLGEAASAAPVEDAGIDAPLQQLIAQDRVELVRESQLWQRLGLVEPDPDIQRLYTPAMLAELVRVPVAVVHRWYRRGWIRAARLVHKLPYFDFQEVTTARRFAELYAAGASPQTIERQMADLARSLPDVSRPLTQLPVQIEGKRILLRQEDRLMEPSGQFRFDFEAASTLEAKAQSPPARLPIETTPLFGQEEGRTYGVDAPPYYTPEELLQIAGELDEAGRLREAAEMVRAALAAAGPSAEVCFQLADLLYRLGDLSAARERYYMAIELDENFVEARNNLGCLLAETGEMELALAAFQGALAYHPHYADAHYHLARLLDELGRPQEAEIHWRSFLILAPESPWVEQARSRLEQPGS